MAQTARNASGCVGRCGVRRGATCVSSPKRTPGRWVDLYQHTSLLKNESVEMWGVFKRVRDRTTGPTESAEPPRRAERAQPVARMPRSGRDRSCRLSRPRRRPPVPARPCGLSGAAVGNGCKGGQGWGDRQMRGGEERGSMAAASRGREERRAEQRGGRQEQWAGAERGSVPTGSAQAGQNRQKER